MPDTQSDIVVITFKHPPHEPGRGSLGRYDGQRTRVVKRLLDPARHCHISYWRLDELTGTF